MFKKFTHKKSEIIQDTDPSKIYVENIRRYFDTNTNEAKRLCDIAVKEGLLKKFYGIECKTCNRIIERFDSKNDIPTNIECIICMHEGREVFSFSREEIEVVEFYQFISKEKK